MDQQFKEERQRKIIAKKPRRFPPLAGLQRLANVCAQKTGQGYKIRALLYSLWNGRAASLLEIVALDWELRKDLLAVMLAFGHHDFFYDQIKSAFVSRGLFDWFTDEEK